MLKWVKEEDQRDKTAKTTYILIEGFVNETACGHICLNNCGTTVIKYSWTVSQFLLLEGNGCYWVLYIEHLYCLAAQVSF